MAPAAIPVATQVTTQPEIKPQPVLVAPPLARSGEEIKVVASAKVLIGEPPNAKVIVNGKEFVLDCIGMVSAIF